MSRVGIIVLADVESHGDLGRVVNALMTAKEFKEAGDEAGIVFDGAGTQWPGLLSDQGHRAHRLYDDVVDKVRGACAYCAHAFEAEAGVRTAGVKLLDEYHGHPSIRGLVTRGFQIISF
jgi:hypothetical protein